MSSRLVKNSHSHKVPQNTAPLDQLTARQREILQLIAEGQTTKSMALVLNVSPKTIEYHRAQLMDRLGIYDVSQGWFASLFVPA